MKTLETRQELAQYVNIKKVPCVSINLDPILDLDNKEWLYAEGGKVRCAYDAGRYGELNTEGNIYCEKGKWYISGNGVCIHSGTGIYKHESLETIEWANSPLVHEGDEIVVIGYFSKVEQCFAYVFKVGKIDPHCMTVCELN